MLDEGMIFKLNESVAVRGLGEKCWAFDTASGKQYRLNELSYDILSMLDGEKDICSITDILLKQYNVDREILLSDILMFMEKAIDKKLVREVLR